MTRIFHSRLLGAALILMSLAIHSRSLAAPFVVTDGDFVGEVYELQYRTFTNQLIENGNAVVLDGTPLDDLFLTNTGNTGQPAWQYFGSDLNVHYLQAPGQFGGFGGGANSTFNTSASATMGWDLSGVTGAVEKVELMASNFLFQFSPWNDEALGDAIFAEVATPGAFGGGPYTNLWQFVSNNADGTGAGAIGEGALIDITGALSGSWLSNPGLLEFRFGYQLQDTDIPGRHLELFRDVAGDGASIDGLRLRITLAPAEVPEPSTTLLLASALLLVAWSRLSRKRLMRCPTFPGARDR
jgi:hypothetical protein